MAKRSAAAAQPTETNNEQSTFDLNGLYNEDDPISLLGELDLGDEVEPDEAPEPTESEDVGEEDIGDEVEDDQGEAEGEEDVSDEPDAEGEESGEADADSETPPEGDTSNSESDGERPKPKEQPFIPKSRFDQRTAQLRAAERELESTRQKLQEIETAKQRAEREANTLSDEQLQAKMTEANAALLEGDTEKAAKLQSEVFGALRTGTETVNENTQQIDPNKIAADVRDQMTFEQTLEKVYNEYPALNDSSESYDEAIAGEAVELQTFYFNQGYTRAEATERAVAAVSKIHGLQSTAQEQAAPVQNDKAAMAKKAQQQSKKDKVAKAQKAPPATSGVAGRTENSTDSVDVESLTVEDWAALPDSVRSRLMGDTI